MFYKLRILVRLLQRVEDLEENMRIQDRFTQLIYKKVSKLEKK